MRRLIPIALVMMAALAPACRPLFEINADTGRKNDDETLPLCERVVSRMIRCSSDPEFRERIEGDRSRAVRACQGPGRKDAERCDAKETCDAFVRCLRE